MRIIYFLIVFLFVCADAWADYTMPIGIPDPGNWGTTHPINSAAPDTVTKCPDWPSATTTGCYYIDNTHGSATDTDNTYGYPNQPRLTIPAGTYAAGAYVEIHGGPYTTEKTVVFSGASDNIVWFRGVSGSEPSIQAKISMAGSTYTIVENLDFNGITGIAVSLSGANTNNVAIRNSTFRSMTYPGSSTAVIAATPNQNGSLHDVVFYGLDFSDVGDWQAAEDQDYHCVNPSLWGRTPPTTTYNIWMLASTSYHCAGSLCQFNGDQRDATVASLEDPVRPISNTNLQNSHHLYSGGNTIYFSRQTIGAFKFSTDCVYSQNTVYSCYSIASEAGTGMGFQEGSNYVWFLFNKLYDLTYGIRQSNTNFPGVDEADLHAYMIGNVIYNIHNNYDRAYQENSAYKPGQGIHFEKGYYTRYLIDNTLHNVLGGLSVGNQVDGDVTVMSGNVISGVTGIDDDSMVDYHVTLLSALGTTSIDYTYFRPRADSGKTKILWAGLDTVRPDTLTAFQTASGQCANCAEGDPLFRYVAGYNLRPAEGSPLIGANTRHAVYDVFEARYGLSIDYDADGNQRPEGAWTIGAYEYQAGVTRKRTRIGSKDIRIGGKSVEITQ